MNEMCPRPDLLMAVEEGVLPEELAREVQAHVAECGICKRLREDLREGGMAEPTLAELARVRQRVRGGGKRRAAWYAAGAVAAGLAMAGGWVASRPAERAKTETATTPSYRLPLAAAPLRLPLGSAMVLRGKEEDGTQAYLKELGASLQAYRERRYTPAAEALRALGVRYPKAVEPPFYEGVSRLLAGDQAGAQAALERARAIGGEALNDDIGWYWAVLLERSGRWTEASATLEGLCKMDGTYRTAACEALRR